MTTTERKPQACRCCGAKCYPIGARVEAPICMNCHYTDAEKKETER